jgi:leucyl-tRNA synthetase
MEKFGLISYTEPFTRLLTQGMVIKDGAKMSKSKGNVVDPSDMIEKYGADTTRLFILFASPPERELEWSDQGVEGSFRFINRLWRVVMENDDLIKKGMTYSGGPDLVTGDGATKLRRKAHQTIRKVTTDIEERFHFNTAIAAVMELTNEVYSFLLEIDRESTTDAHVFLEAVKTAVILLSPAVPHVAEELWEALGNSSSVINVPWPAYDEELAKEEEITIVLQVNGKVRSRVVVEASVSDETMREIALADDKVKKHTEGKDIAKVVVVPGKLVNVVISQ